MKVVKNDSPDYNKRLKRASCVLILFSSISIIGILVDIQNIIADIQKEPVGGICSLIGQLSFLIIGISYYFYIYYKKDQSSTNKTKNQVVTEHIQQHTDTYNKKQVIVFFVLVFIIFIGTMIAFYFYTNHSIIGLYRLYEEEKIAKAKVEKENTTFLIEKMTLKSQTEFMDKNIGIIATDGTSLYHKYNCKNLDKSLSFKAFNISNAINLGYSACPVCHP